LIGSCRKSRTRWWAGRGELGGGVLGFPSQAFGDGMQQQDWSEWDVGIGGRGAFPQVRSILYAVCWLDTGLFQELPNELAPLGPVVPEGFVRPFAGDQDTPSGDPQVFRLVCFALAVSGCDGVSGALGLDAVEQPDGAPG
jgi:hypothetical protein